MAAVENVCLPTLVWVGQRCYRKRAIHYPDAGSDEDDYEVCSLRTACSSHSPQRATRRTKLARR